MTPELSEAERLEWESEKYSSRTLSVRVLSSGNVVICTNGLAVRKVWDATGFGEFDLYETLKEFCSEPLEEYRPPKQRLEERTAQITEGLLSGLSLKI